MLGDMNFFKLTILAYPLMEWSKGQCQSFLKVWKSLQSAPKRLGAHIAFDSFSPLKPWEKDKGEAATEGWRRGETAIGPLDAHKALTAFSL